MASTYKIGGILQALHGENAKENVITNETGANDKKEKGNENHLMNLFTVTAKPELEDADAGDDDESDVQDDLINDSNVVKKQTDIKEAKQNLSPQKQKKEKQKESPERLERTLFIGNVSLNVTKKMLKKVFAKFGEIETLRFRSFIGADLKVPKKVAVIKKDFHSECKSLNAYVVYKSKESIGKALTCNGLVLEGLHLRVDTATPEKQNRNKNALFVGNLPFNVPDEDVYRHFEKCGTIDYVRLIRDKATGAGKGFGYVTFKNGDGVVFGLKLNGSQLNGRAIRVSRCENSMKNQNTDRNNRNRKNSQQFCGLKATTSMKDRVKGKKLVQEKIRTSSNAMRRIKNKAGGKKKVKTVKHNQKLSKRKK